MTTVHLLDHRVTVHGWWGTPQRDAPFLCEVNHGSDLSAEQMLEGLTTLSHAPLVLACISANGTVARSCLRSRVTRLVDSGPQVVERFDASPTLSTLPGRRRLGDEPFIRAQLLTPDVLVLPAIVRNSQVQEFRLWLHRNDWKLLPGRDPIVSDCREPHR